MENSNNGAGDVPLRRLVRIRELWVGDRFTAYGSLWTHLGATGDGETATARKHSAESINLGARGYGYIGDSICSFGLTEQVQFCNPNTEVSHADKTSQL